jgi:malonyl CoA-acyl carrier protein transacylase
MIDSARNSSTASTPAPTAWESEVFVLAAREGGELRGILQALDDFVGGKDDLDLKDLAFTLASELPPAPGGSRLAVVAGSAAELRQRLTRAAERLSDPKTRSINDTQGIYYFAEPLGPAGRLALLFPGEGGQYLNMLADLFPHFPEVRAHFEQCDRLSLQAGRCEPISRALFLPEEASPQQRARAEEELWRLDVAIAAMLIADWSIFQVLTNLGVRPDMVGGHSAGEFSALAAAGCLEQGDFLVEQLFTLGTILRREDDNGGMAEAALLAAATSRRKAVEALERSGAAVHLAMDNCPHQVVLAGSPEAISVVEAELRGRGVVCERLPFGRPYHTPQFEPHLPPVARMYERLPVRAPRIPVFSCTTGKPFPPEPDAIRRLAVEHWAAPVEFVQMIEGMYAEGVRIFVEAGPRGHVTSFVEDILRGRPFAAMAANVSRRSGITQINHLVAHLFAHHVPLRLEHLYLRRQPRLIAWKATPTRSASEDRGDSLACASGWCGTALHKYLGVMEQFLDLQREVNSAFLAGRVNPPADSPPPRPMLGALLRHVPGSHLLMRRRIDLDEDIYARHHTLGGRHASALDPEHHGLPVVPMAFSMEMMAEAAAVLAPGLRVVRLEGVRLHRWIALDEEPVTLEVDARVLRASPRRVAVTVRDLGNAAHLPAQDSPSVEAVVELAESYPEALAVGDFPLTNPGPCLYSPHQLYEGERRMFHGPLFQAVCGTQRQGQEGIEGSLRALPHSGLFRSFPSPELLTDPLLIDASTHLLGCWHLARPDPAGRVVFPYEIGALDLFGPPPPTGTEICCRVRVERRTARQVRHRIELIGGDGRLLYRLAPAEYWRFYWPQEYVDFFRVKEDFLLAHPWPRPATGPEDLPPHHVACAAQAENSLRLDIPEDLRQPVLRASVARVALSPAEWGQFKSLQMSEDETTSWLYDRIAAKDAARAAYWLRCQERLAPADLEVEMGQNGFAVVWRRASGDEVARVTLAHAPDAVLATPVETHAEVLA